MHKNLASILVYLLKLLSLMFLLPSPSHHQKDIQLPNDPKGLEEAPSHYNLFYQWLSLSSRTPIGKTSNHQIWNLNVKGRLPRCSLFPNFLSTIKAIQLHQ